MIEFAAPWMFLALLLPPLVNRLFRPHKERQSSLQVPFFQRLVELTRQQPSQGAVVLQRRRIQRLMLIVAWSLLVIALAKPEYVGEPVVQHKAGRDLMVAVDLSGSMQADDFTDAQGKRIDRLSAVKSVLRDFVRQRSGDRLGLIVFGDRPFLQTPFTEDLTTWLQLLEETDIGMAGLSTGLGDAIGLALKRFANSDSPDRVLILLTDGNDTGSKVPPIDAAKVAAAYEITLYTIAIGDPATVGEKALDIETLERMSALTGGEYFQALDRHQLARVYQRINQLEPQRFESLSYRPRQALHQYPMGAVLVLYLVFFSSQRWRLWRQQRAQSHA
ncbi:VWA domain-containing protein [Aestuariirhabdus sp. Z084]|uniref:vWA domain-containing protein n=1 Tax=Aestuariirhabdus haliotis TaxID=2918751 RepID=UPI00201B3864|nr:VWA domain-containing protein [Aestuariirhabdus haliotis]MCL6416446.1 VWA domain-containing protein [Aestuariirhabdus haliotis]MCL6420387.1 VWA domain-containing protein [Aestuariirhabdus haliotis]